MRKNESKKLRKIFDKFNLDDITPLVEIGSSTVEFRKKVKPHIYNELHEPLINRGVNIITTDLKSGQGIMISGDFFSETTLKKIIEYSPNALLCANILEHVDDPRGFLNRCDKILSCGGLIFITVPYSFPYHQDPIDTMFRPTPLQIAELLPSYEILYSEVHVDTTYWDDLFNSGFLKFLLRFFLMWPLRLIDIRCGFDKWKKKNQRLLWLFQHYKISIVVARKLSDSSSLDFAKK